MLLVLLVQSGGDAQREVFGFIHASIWKYALEILDVCMCQYQKQYLKKKCVSFLNLTLITIRSFEQADICLCSIRKLPGSFEKSVLALA